MLNCGKTDNDGLLERVMMVQSKPKTFYLIYCLAESILCYWMWFDVIRKRLCTITFPFTGQAGSLTLLGPVKAAFQMVFPFYIFIWKGRPARPLMYFSCLHIYRGLSLLPLAVPRAAQWPEKQTLLLARVATFSWPYIKSVMFSLPHFLNFVTDLSCSRPSHAPFLLHTGCGFVYITVSSFICIMCHPDTQVPYLRDLPSTSHLPCFL